MQTRQVNEIFEIFSRQNPNPVTELNFTSAFECLIAVMLSAQTTDIQVNKVTSKLFAVANTPESMLALGEAKITEYIKHIGLFRNKARHAIGISQMLVQQYDAIVPGSVSELQKLPGVGRKTALVVLNAMFGEATLAVDTHVQRVSHRIGLVRNCNTPLKTEQALMKVIPEQYLYNAHHWLILHGRYICKARSPMCDSCLIADLCKYYKATKTN